MIKIDMKDAQAVLKKGGFDPGGIDGIYGKNTNAAARKAFTPRSIWTNYRNLVAAVQSVISKANIDVGAIDGLFGPMTEAGVEVYLEKKAWRGFNKPPSKDASSGKWPYYRDMVGFYGAVGTNQVLLETPYPMLLAWDTDTTISRFSINRKCRDSAARIFQNTLAYYGYDRIKELHLDLFGGCLNVRKMRGGSKYSVHSWGAAIDMDPVDNRLRMRAEQAEFAGQAYDQYFGYVKAEGWVSLGRDKGYDYMHTEALRI